VSGSPEVTDDFAAAIRQQVAEREARIEHATQIYEALKTYGQLHSHRLLTYRCQAGRCTLLDVVDGAAPGLILGFPRYKTSPAKTEVSSTQSGRRKNTEDGDRHWKGRGFFGNDFSGALPLNCDHTYNVSLSHEVLTAHLEAGHSEVIVRTDGTLYVR
jgi:hypothetical protein